MNPNEIVISGSGEAENKLLIALTEDILRERGLDYDHKAGFCVRREGKIHNPVWAVGFQIAPNAFGFTSETYWVEFNHAHKFIDIRTPRGRMSHITGKSDKTSVPVFVHR